jgi:hypothetical protein
MVLRRYSAVSGHMWFNIAVGNHGGVAGVIGLAPLITYFRKALSLCGHEVTIAYNPARGAVNLFFEHFLGAEWAKEFRNLRQNHGMKIGVVATELMVTVRGQAQIPYARHGIVYGGGQDIDKMMALRMQGFEAILGEIDFLWPLIRRTADEYRKRTRVCEFFPFGSLGAGTPSDVRRSPKDIEIFFFGKNTPHRANALTGFAQRGINVMTVGHGFRSERQPDIIIESMIDRAKIGLNLALHGVEEMEGGVDPRFASCQRIVDMLNGSLCVVSEHIPLDNPYSDFMMSAPVDELFDVCRKMLADGSWREIGEQNSTRFHEAMDVRKVCSPVIERTLATLA